MRWNPYTDPFVERGYFGYSLRGIAYRKVGKYFVPQAEIRDLASGENELFYDRTFAEIFADADEAIRRAMGKGEQIIDNLLEHLNQGESTDLVQGPVRRKRHCGGRALQAAAKCKRDLWVLAPVH